MRADRATGRRVASFVCAAAFSVLAGLAAPQGAAALEPADEEPLLVDEEVIPPARNDARVLDPHDPSRAMHPVRVAAYALHPVGVALDWLLVRPAVWVVRQEPFRTIFGYED